MALEALVRTGSPAYEPEALSFPTLNGEAVSSPRPRVQVGGVLVDQVDLDGAVERIERLVRSPGAHQIVTVNLDFLSIARRNATFMDTLNQADLAVADGMPLVWLSRWQGTPLTQRIAGVELFAACCEVAAGDGRSVFLLGAAPGVADEVRAKLEQRYPGLQVVGAYAPPVGQLTQQEDDRIVAMIRQVAPHFLFVALGAPRQDLWIRAHLSELHVPVSMGVGCVFDLYAGAVKRAPSWMQRMGLEWAFRLGQEPARLWRRYLVDDLPTLAQLMLSSRTKQASAGLAIQS